MSFMFNIKNGVRSVFIHIPKNGGHSVVESLGRFLIKPASGTRTKNLVGHFTYLETKAKIGKEKTQAREMTTKNTTQRNLLRKWLNSTRE